MQCPKCDAPSFTPEHPCKECGFRGAIESIEELSHLDWVLEELPLWQAEERIDLHAIRGGYETRRQALRTALGLVPAPLTAEEFQEASLKLYRQACLRDLLVSWLRHDLIHPRTVAPFLGEIEAFVEATQRRLQAIARFEFVLLTRETRLAVMDFLLANVRQLSAVNAFVSDAAEAGLRLSEFDAHEFGCFVDPPYSDETVDEEID